VVDNNKSIYKVICPYAVLGEKKINKRKPGKLNDILDSSV
jgi:hypothetical protein